MVRHIVMWKLKDFESQNEKSAAIEEMKSALESLKGIIPQVEQISVYNNSKLAPQDNFDVMLDSSFASFTDLDAYQKHPEHMKAAAIVKKYAVGRSCVDYEA